MNLLDSTHALLQAALKRGVTIPQIVAASNGEIGRDWLYKMRDKLIPNPGYNSVATLHACLSKLNRKSA